MPDLKKRSLVDVISPDKNSVISVVGAGGKTTTIFTLARELSSNGFSVLIASTTAMFHPDKLKHPYDKLIIGTPETVISSVYPDVGKITFAAGLYDQQTEKVKGYKPEEVDFFYKKGIFDFILVEADGARQLPIKAPADHEPLIPSSTSIVIGVVGLNCLDKPLHSSHVHRPEIFSELCSLPMGGKITESTIESLVHAPNGLFKHSPVKAKNIVLLNKADNKTLEQRGSNIIKAIQQKNSLSLKISKVLIRRLFKQV